MEKGFFRHLSRPLAGAALAACLFSSSALTAKHPAPWWEVLLEITAKGRYAVSGGEAPVTGDYVCRVLWEGRLEPDDEDFLLVHLRTEVLEWRLRERSGPAGRESVLEAPSAPGPTMRMNYVLKDEREVEFVFDLGGVSIPLHASPLAVALELPRSSGRTSGGRGKAYGDFVGSGSSRIVIPESDLEQRNPERHFSWDWRRERQYVRNGRILTVAQSHAAEAVVTVTAH
jgi:hypothetical protein